MSTILFELIGNIVAICCKSWKSFLCLFAAVALGLFLHLTWPDAICTWFVSVPLTTATVLFFKNQ